jgi:hypothetical protein
LQQIPFKIFLGSEHPALARELAFFRVVEVEGRRRGVGLVDYVVR